MQDSTMYHPCEKFKSQKFTDISRYEIYRNKKLFRERNFVDHPKLYLKTIISARIPLLPLPQPVQHHLSFYITDVPVCDKICCPSSLRTIKIRPSGLRFNYLFALELDQAYTDPKPPLHFK
jgi:hypothetical protein